MTTTYLVPFEHGQQTDANGDPYSGALLYVYQSTTTTAVSLFSDSAGSTSAANPIVADSSGRLALRYTTYAGALTLVLKTSAGATIWTQDDIYPVVHSGSLGFTGNVSISKASAQFLLDSASGDVLSILDREAGNNAIISGRTANVERWRVIPGNSTAEGGANAGSDYIVQAFDDAGASLGNAFKITRSTRLAQFVAAAPMTSDGGALGSVSLMWSDAFFADGAVLNFNNGNYTITHSNGVMAFSGMISAVGGIKGGVQTLTGAGAINLTTLTTKLITTGANALTLADGSEGQIKTIIMFTDGGDGTLTPTNFGNGTTITFNDVGDSVTLQFIGTDWWLLSNVGCTIA